jgi:hypothetical protein
VSHFEDRSHVVPTPKLRFPHWYALANKPGHARIYQTSKLSQQNPTWVTWQHAATRGNKGAGVYFPVW